MSFETASLLEPLGGDEPCGPELRDLSDGDQFHELASSEKPVDWGRQRDRVLSLAQGCRDLRVWIWLTRSSLSADGWTGLAAGLELIADGLDCFWDKLPPYDPEETNPRERFMGRLAALSSLGVSSSLFLPADLAKRRDVYFLSQELDTLIARTEPAPAVEQAAARIDAVLSRIGDLVRARFGPGNDPQLGFELLRGKLSLLTAKLRGAGVGAEPGQEEAPVGSSTPIRPAAQGPIGSRDDVVRTLDLVLAYYRIHEPSSPVPLLIERAKRLVPMSFVEAMRDLAPTGAKELAVIAGPADDKGK